MGQHTFKLQIGGQERSASVDILEVKDIVMFVAGTTDPINTTGGNHHANKTYWQGEKADLENLWSAVKELKPQYLDLHILDKFFSWSGDNSNEERTKAAERLLDLFLRVYSNWTDEEVFLHLIGHSHGGNVINQFTEIIAESPDFPEKWKVKSIMYLSTPFFQKQHQLNHAKLHGDCKIINVYNEYDITQRFVADFTLKNLEILLSNFDDAVIKRGITIIQQTDFSAFDLLGELNINNKTEGPFLWTQTENLLEGVEELFSGIISYVNTFEDGGILSGQKAELLLRLGEIHTWASTQRPIFDGNRATRRGGYGRSEFLDDLNFVGLMGIANTIFAIDTGIQDSYLLGLLDSISTSPTGITDRIDDTTWTPEEQVQGKFEIIPVPILDKDPYHTRNKKSQYDGFITGVENCVKANKPFTIRELLMRLFSQLIAPTALDGAISKINSLEWVISGANDRAAKTLKANLIQYRGLIQQYHADLIAETDIENTSLAIKPGSLPYLAMDSHNLSRTALFPKAKEALTSAFGSGKNPGYKE